MVSIAITSCVPAISSLNSTVIVLSSATASLGVTATTSNGVSGSGSTVISRSVTIIVEPASFTFQWLIPIFCALMYWPASALNRQNPFSA